METEVQPPVKLSPEEELRRFNEALQVERQGDEEVQRGQAGLSLWERFKRRNTEVGRSVVRGIANIPDQIDNTLLDLTSAGARLVGAEGAAKHTEGIRERKGKGEGLLVQTDRIFGRRSDDAVAAFTESASQFLGAFALTPGGGVTGGATKVAAVGAARGAAVDFAAFDPKEEQLAELVAKAPWAPVRAIGDLLTPDADDSNLEARIKRAAIGIVPGVVIDGLLAGAKRIRAAKRGDSQGVAEAEQVLEAVAKGEHTPEGAAFVARPVEDGQWEVRPLDDVVQTAEPRGMDYAKASPEVVVSAAQKTRDGRLFIAPTHGEAINAAGDDALFDMADENANGFLTSHGRFVSREEALDIAENVGPLGQRDVNLSQAEELGELDSTFLSRSDETGPRPVGEYKAPAPEPIEPDPELLADIARFADRAEAEATAESLNIGARETQLAEAVRGNGNGKGPKPPNLDAAKVPVGKSPMLDEETVQRAALYGVTPEEILAVHGGGQARQLVRTLSTAEPKMVQTLVNEEGIAGFEVSIFNTPDEVFQKQEGLAREMQAEIESIWSQNDATTVARVKEMASELMRGLDLHEQAASVVRLLDRGTTAAQWAKETAAALVLDGMGKKIAGMFDALDSRPHDMVLHEQARQAITQYMTVGRRYAASGSNHGLSLRMRQEATKGAEYLGAAGKETEEVPREIVSDLIAGMSKMEILDTVRLFRMAGGRPGNAKAVLGAVEVIKETGSTSKALEWFTNALLSGPTTHTTAATMNGITSVVEGFSRIAGGAVTGNTPLAREGAEMLWGHVKYAMDNIRVANAAFKQGYSQIAAGGQVRIAWGGRAGTLIRTPQRVLLWIDEMTRVSNYRSYVRAKSLRFHRERGLTGSALESQVEADLRSSFDDKGRALIPEAMQFAEGPTMSAALGPDTMGGAVHDFVNKHPVTRFVAPFVKTSINIFRYTFDRTPLLNQFSSRVKEVMARGGEEATILQTQTALAGSMYLFGLGGVMSGQLTGRGPSDPKLRALWLKDHKPYSIKINGEWQSYRRGDPMFAPVGLIADASTALRELIGDDRGEAEAEEMVYALIAGLAASFSNKTYMVGVTDFFSAMSSGDGYRTKRWMQGLITGFIPQMGNKFNTDPYLREVDGLVDAIMAKVPGWSDNLPAKYDLFGEPVARQFQPADPFPEMGEVKESVASTLLQLKRGFAMPPKNIEGVSLTDRQFAKNGVTPWERMQELIREPGNGRVSLEAKLTDLVKSDKWERASTGSAMYPGGERWLMAAAVIDEYQQRALGKVRREYPELNDAITLQKRLKAKSITEGQDGALRVLEEAAASQR